MENSDWDEVKTDQVDIELNDQVKISYYLLQKTNPMDSSDVMYELHGNCWAWGVDTSDWVTGESKFSCDMGLYYFADNIVDWQTVDMLYQGEDGEATWSCKDGKSTSATSFSYTEDGTSNCMANGAKSSATFPEAGSGIFQSHWMRPFSTGDDDDLTLLVDNTLSASLRITLGDSTPVEKFDA